MADLLVNEGMNARDRDVRTKIIQKLGEDGYATYAERLKDFEFLVADAYKGKRVDTAAMFDDGTIVFSRNWFLPGLSEEQTLDQLSVLVRHEMLHYLLAHIIRMKEYLQKKFPNLVIDGERIDFSKLTPEETLELQALLNADNTAADWDLSQKYDDYDKEVVRNMTLCGEVIGGLILEDQHPEWMGLNYEEILERAAEEIKPQIQQAIEQQQNMPKMEIHIEEENHSPEYIEIYNKIIDKYDDDKYSDQELVDLVEKALQDGEIDL